MGPALVPVSAVVPPGGNSIYNYCVAVGGSAAQSHKPIQAFLQVIYVKNSNKNTANDFKTLFSNNFENEAVWNN